MRSLAREHLTYVLWTMLMITVLSAMSEQEFDRFIDCRNLRQLLEQRAGRQPVILVASHFFSHILAAAVSDTCHRVGPLCGSLALTEDQRLSRILEPLKRRYHWHDAIAVNLGASAARDAQLRASMGFLRKGSGVLAVFGDYRAEVSERDMVFKLGQDTLFSNRGFEYVTRKFHNAPVIPIHALYRAGRLQVVLGEALPPQRPVATYYEEVLPNIIERDLAQWHLWFLARNMMAESGSATASSVAIGRQQRIQVMRPAQLNLRAQNA